MTNAIDTPSLQHIWEHHSRKSICLSMGAFAFVVGCVSLTSGITNPYFFMQVGYAIFGPWLLLGGGATLLTRSLLALRGTTVGMIMWGLWHLIILSLISLSSGMFNLTVIGSIAALLILGLGGYGLHASRQLKSNPSQPITKDAHQYFSSLLRTLLRKSEDDLDTIIEFRNSGPLRLKWKGLLVNNEIMLCNFVLQRVLVFHRDEFSIIPDNTSATDKEISIQVHMGETTIKTTMSHTSWLHYQAWASNKAHN